MKKKIILYSLVILPIFLFYHFGRSIWHPIVLKVVGKKTVIEVIDKYKQSVNEELLPFFQRESIQYPPKQLALIAFKDTKILELWASNGDDNFKRITSYPIKATSGKAGPKLREGDRQVPEGLYKITSFNPNSSFHLSMKINYPNKFDLKYAKIDGRNQPGTNIFIHGHSVSVGCLAMGNSAIERLFVLAHDTGLQNTQILITPTDPSKNRLVVPKSSPDWITELYENIEKQYVKITRNTVI